jgi:hypothetical protein
MACPMQHTVNGRSDDQQQKIAIIGYYIQYTISQSTLLIVYLFLVIS